MKRLLCLLVCASGALCAGCELAVNVACTTCTEVRHRTEEGLERYRNRRLADSAWKEVEASCPGQPYSREYTRGFKAGYADYLFEGGTGEPPAFPPSCYWGVGYQTPDGAQSMADWTAGFRHGAAVARASGLRDLVVLPLTDDPPAGPPPPPPPEPAPPPLGTGAETLPPPRTVPEAGPGAPLVPPPPRKQHDPLPPDAGPASGASPAVIRQSSLRAPPGQRLSPPPPPPGAALPADEEAGDPNRGPVVPVAPRRDGPRLPPFGPAGWSPGPG